MGGYHDFVELQEKRNSLNADAVGKVKVVAKG